MELRSRLFFLGLLLLARCTAPTAAERTSENAAKHLGVIFTASRQGEVDPCGCQLHQLGGLERFANLVLKKRMDSGGAPLIVIDSGDTFFAAPHLNPSRISSARATAKAIARGYAVMEIAAMVPGERDLAQGVPFLKEITAFAKTRVVASNLLDEKGERLFEENFIWERGNVKVGIFGLVSDEAYVGLSPGYRITPWKQAAEEQVAKLRAAKVDFVIALSHLGLAMDRELAQVAGIDLISGSHSQDVTSAPVREGSSTIVQPHPQGHQAGYLKLSSTPDSIGDFAMVDLDQHFDGRNQVSEILEELKKEIGTASISEAGGAYRATSERPYVAHAFTCRKCHVAQYNFWEKTKHSSAFLVLFSKGQHFNPECVACHTLGFQQPGGFESIANPVVVKGKKTGTSPFIESWMRLVFAEEAAKGPLDSRLQKDRHLKLHQNYHRELKRLEAKGQVTRWNIGVQCEHCHGNRNGHPDPKFQPVGKVSETACKQCHIPPNAPNFDPTTITKVACPRMKKGKG